MGNYNKQNSGLACSPLHTLQVKWKHLKITDYQVENIDAGFIFYFLKSEKHFSFVQHIDQFKTNEL